MKYVVIADLHCKLKNYSLLVDGIPEHLYFPLLNLRNAAKLAKENNASLIVAGDIADSKTFLHQQVISEISEAINEIKTQVETFWLLGNHDYQILNGKLYSYLTSFDINLSTPNNPITTDELALVAYSDPETIVEDIRNCNIKEKKLLVSHFSIEEAELSGTEYKSSGFKIKDFDELKPLLIVLGHYHKPQKVSDNIYYVGSPVETRISERGEEKRILLIDTDDNTIKSIPTVYPKTITLNLKQDSDIDYEKIKNNILETYSKYFITIPNNYNKLKEITKLTNDLRGYVYVKIEDDSSDNIDEKSNQEFSVDSIDMDSIFEEFMKLSVYEENLKDRYLKSIKEIWKEVSL
ncbi:MAG: metallophosphoesterase family protein [Nanopusillaceae archaeon]